MTHGSLRSDRRRLAALSMGSLALAYIALSVQYFYEDFFRFVTPDSPIYVTASGFAVQLNAEIATLLSPWRLLLAGITVGLLIASTRALWRGRPRARVLALLTLWGALFPQILWYAEFLVDWNAGQGLGVLAAAWTAVVVLPTIVLANDWRSEPHWGLRHERGRLMAMAISFAWLAFAATEILDHSWQIDSLLAYLAAGATVPLAAAAAAGMFHLKRWALGFGLAAAALIGIVPLATVSSSYVATGGYTDALHQVAAGSSCRAFLAGLVPLALVCAVASPYLRRYLRK